MENLLTYTINGETINLNDVIHINEIELYIKEIFLLNNIVYVSYVDNVGTGLIIETAEKLINDKKDFLHNITTQSLDNFDCSCGKEH